MDVRITLNVLLLSVLVMTTACQKKNENDVFPNNADSQGGGGSSECPTQELIKSEFMVTYEDGRFEKVKAENREVFVKNFLHPRLQEIKHVEYNQRIHIREDFEVDQSSAEFQTQSTTQTHWDTDIIQAPSAWNDNVLGQNVKVAVVDAAIDYSQTQIKPRLSPNLAEINGLDGVDDDGNGFVDDKYGWDFADNQPQPVISAKNYHATHVAGIIAADHDSGSVLGVAPKAEIVPVNFMDQEGGGSLADAISAIRYSASRGAKVINASWGGPGCSETLKQTIADLNQQNILFVVAAGNDGADYDRLGPSSYEYPAAFNLPNQLTVAATDSNDNMASFSNKSFHLVHVAAPGTLILSTVPLLTSATGTKAVSGTSMATPFVSGVAALLWSAKPNATVSQIRDAIINSVDVSTLKVSTQGRVNVQRALNEIRRIAP